MAGQTMACIPINLLFLCHLIPVILTLCALSIVFHSGHRQMLLSPRMTLPLSLLPIIFRLPELAVVSLSNSLRIFLP